MGNKDLIKKIEDLTPGLFENKKFVPGETFIPTGWAVYGHEELNAIIESVVSGQLGLGHKGKEFEKEYSKYMSRKHTVLVNSGSSASLLALEGIKEKFKLHPGDEIVTPACGFPTTINPIFQLGFKPTFVDIDSTYNISIEEFKKSINKKTKGVFFAHTLGNPAKMDEIMEISKENGLFVIEDCCDAYGAKYNNKKCGSFGNVATSSFYPAHHITLGGEGGAVSIDDFQLYRSIKSFRDWGKACHCEPNQDNACGKRFEFKIGDTPYDHKYIFSRLGYNLKPTEMQAAMGVEQLKKIEDLNQKRKDNFEIYMDRFSEFKEFFDLPDIYEKADPIFFGFPLLINNKSIDRKNLTLYLNENKIGTRYLFGGNLTHQPAYKGLEYNVIGDLKKTNDVEKDLFWLGIHPGMGEKEIDYIGERIEKYLLKN